MCDHHLNGGPLVCNRNTPHTAPNGCTFAASDLGDGHTASEEAAEQRHEL